MYIDFDEKEKENFLHLREQLNQAVRDLPAFLEELKKVRMGDDMIEKLVRDFKDEMFQSSYTSSFKTKENFA